MIRDNVGIEISNEGVFIINLDTKQGACIKGQIILSVNDEMMKEACKLLGINASDVVRIASKFYDAFAIEGEAYG